MFFDGNFYWLLNGILLVVIVMGLKTFAEDKGWTMTWWKWLLTGLWYLIFSTGFYGWGTLIGENFASAGFKMFLATFFASIILGVGLWRVLASGSQKS